MTHQLHFPSAPSRPTKHSATFVRNFRTSPRYTTHGFCTPEAMRSFIDLVIDGNKFTWLDDECIYVEEYDMNIHCQTLEDVMETTQTIPMPHPYDQYANQSAGREWEPMQDRSKTKGDDLAGKKSRQRPSRPKKGVTPRKNDDGSLTPAQLAEELSIKPAKLRQKLRSAGIQKPEGGWKFDEELADQVRQMFN